MKGQEFLKKAEFFKLDHDGTLTTLKRSIGIKDEKERQKYIKMETAKGIYGFEDMKLVGQDIIAVGRFGSYDFDLKGRVKNRMFFDLIPEKIRIGPYEQESYDLQLDNLRIVQLTPDRYGFLSFGLTQGVQIYDESGHQIWTYGKEEIKASDLLQNERERQAKYDKSVYVLEAAVGDLDGDGISEYIVARKNDGTRAFDREGHEKWFQPDDFPSERLEVLDLDGNGKNEIVQLGKGIRKGDGSLLRETKGGYGKAMLLATGNDKKISVQYCEIDQLRLTCNGEGGDVVLSGPAPLSDVKLDKPRKLDIPGQEPITFDKESSNELKAVWIRFEKDKPPYLAIVASFIGIPRANFYVYDPMGALLYHELLPESAETMLVVPGENDAEQLLIGGKETIWKYKH
ncbi:MAG TPA: hypothetical protein VE863_02495 [Pyrinomonadaceae bacterium]|nr:hypothetical protein [Pyrinomonadaceae bacterium]